MLGMGGQREARERDHRGRGRLLGGDGGQPGHGRPRHRPHGGLFRDGLRLLLRHPRRRGRNHPLHDQVLGQGGRWRPGLRGRGDQGRRAVRDGELPAERQPWDLVTRDVHRRGRRIRLRHPQRQPGQMLGDGDGREDRAREERCDWRRVGGDGRRPGIRGAVHARAHAGPALRPACRGGGALPGDPGQHQLVRR